MVFAVNSALKIFIIRRQRKRYLANNILLKYSINANNTYYTKQETQFKISLMSQRATDIFVIMTLYYIIKL